MHETRRSSDVWFDLVKCIQTAFPSLFGCPTVGLFTVASERLTNPRIPMQFMLLRTWCFSTKLCSLIFSGNAFHQGFPGATSGHQRAPEPWLTALQLHCVGRSSLKQKVHGRLWRLWRLCFMRPVSCIFLPALGPPATEVVHLLHRRRAVDDMET